MSISRLADSLADLPKWYAPNRIIALARLAVLPRPGYEPSLDVVADKLAAKAGQLLTDSVIRRSWFLIHIFLLISSD